jgi:hypothetical protein
MPSQAVVSNSGGLQIGTRTRWQFFWERQPSAASTRACRAQGVAAHGGAEDPQVAGDQQEQADGWQARGHIGEACFDLERHRSTITSRLMLTNRPRSIEFSSQDQLLLASGFGPWAREGALLSYGPDTDDSRGCRPQGSMYRRKTTRREAFPRPASKPSSTVFRLRLRPESSPGQYLKWFRFA